jgi:cellulose synthase/poly-beta-1,6-N-acetylglucosamine synthase-like glycosyltransferase
MKKIITSTILVASSIASALAQTTYTPTVANTTTVNGSAIQQFILLISNVTNALIPIAVTLALLSFFWFLVQFIWKGAEEGEKRKNALSGMGWSIVALFVMVSIWGLVGFIGSITGVGQGGKVPIPGVL